MKEGWLISYPIPVFLIDGLNKINLLNPYILGAVAVWSLALEFQGLELHSLSFSY